MTTNRSIKNDLTLVTVISIVSYGVVYFFQSGIAQYFGYPVDFINVDLTMLIKTIFAFFIALTFLANLLDIHFAFTHLSIRQNIITCIVFFFLFSLYFMGSFNPLASFFYGYIAVPVHLMLSSITLVMSLVFIAKLSKNNFSEFSFKSFLIAIFLIMLTPYSLGWLSAYKTKNIFSSDNLYLLNSYGSFLVLGECDNGKSSFILTEGNQGLKFSISDSDSVTKFKKCLEVASKKS
ncbi:hypothetical protein [Yersinia rohdei]|uniref:hypothetical protein n=1 Tax=Yersinia rohdei TaxID=29485 RepID=UPI0025AA6D73|nr:hypothetical protein [Yersinia rohdei]MDN0093878.1 hypothetical protein [Yersinia rohdei]